jgi:hypothetical protein
MELDTDYPKRDGKPIPNSVNTEQVQQVATYKVPTEIIDLPSKGLLYPKDSPLSSGTLEIKYMTAKEEDILSTESYIRKGIVLEKFLESIIVTPNVSLSDMLIGDIDALTIAARIYGYGKDYEAFVETPSGKKQRIEVDLTQLDFNLLEERFIKEKGINEFDFELPKSKVQISFKMLTQKDQKRYLEEVEKNKKAFSGETKSASTQFVYQLVSVNGSTDEKFIREFVDEGLMAFDARALRKYIETIQPGVNLSVEEVDRETNQPFSVDIPISLQFFWPDIKI